MSMELFNKNYLKQLYLPRGDSHKGQNGKLMVIGGSGLFHAASLWSLTIASRIVDMVFYSSVPQNNEIVHELKKEFRDGIVVPRDQIEDYIKEADAVLIGPGMMRAKSQNSNHKTAITGLREINDLKDEGEQSYYITRYLLEKYPKKKWVIDAGALQMLEPEWLMQLNGNAVITPHIGEFEIVRSKTKNPALTQESVGKQKLEKQADLFAKQYKCITLLKGQEDIVCSPEICLKVVGGNAGMTKGGTGDVLAGLVASLACKNDLWVASVCASFINKKAGEKLFEKVGLYFNSSDLADEIPRVMSGLLM